MATRRGKANSKSDIDSIFHVLTSQQVGEPKIKKPKKGLEEEVSEIYKQASRHRDWLIKFFLAYTTAFSLLVVLLISVQVGARLTIGNENLEIIPQWALYLLVVGMFGQFIGLLTIVTKKVWTFEPFFKHHTDSLKSDSPK